MADLKNVDMAALGKELGLNLEGYRVVNAYPNDGLIEIINEDPNDAHKRSDVDGCHKKGFWKHCYERYVCNDEYILNDKGQVLLRDVCTGGEHKVYRWLLETLEDSEDVVKIIEKVSIWEILTQFEESAGDGAVWTYYLSKDEALAHEKIVLAALGEMFGFKFEVEHASEIEDMKEKLFVEEPVTTIEIEGAEVIDESDSIEE